MSRSSRTCGVRAAAAALLLFAGVPSSLLLTSPAAAASPADNEIARTLVGQGRELGEKGDWAGAREKFKQAFQLVQAPIVALDLAGAHVHLGELVEAREVYLSVARIPVTADETDRSAAARKEAATLAESLTARVPTVTIRLVRAPKERAVVTLDSRPVPSPADPQKVNPGKHILVARFAGGEVSENFEVKEGETREVVVDLKQEQEVAPPPKERTEPPVQRSGNALIYGGFGVAGAGFLVGAVTGMVALNKAAFLDGRCGDDKLCPPEATSEKDTGMTFATISTISFGVALAGAAVGIYGLVSRPHTQKSDTHARAPRVEPWLGVGSAGLRGAF